MATHNTSRLKFLAAGIALLSAACTVSSTDIPSLTGPSELALSFAVTASPDSITQDGRSQSLITVTARNENGQPKSGVVFRLDMLVGGVAADYGTLSGKTVVTGSDGRATASYTSPNPVVSGGNVGACAPSVFSPLLPGACVTIAASPIGTGFTNNQTSQTVDIHLVPLGVILPPADTPTAAFVVTPTPVSANVATNFDGSLSCGGPLNGSTCNSGNVIVAYAWGFGDGAAATGRAVQHAYASPGTYTVILTVTNDGGKSATTSQSVTVSASAPPSADFTFSPTSPAVGETIHFNAATSKAAPGRTLTSFAWTFGDGVGGNAQFFDHGYSAAATYQVTLTVTDDAGQSATAKQSVTVGAGNPVASLVVTKTGGLSIQADARGSSAAGGASIATYSYLWGDATSTSPGLAVQPKVYGVGGTYTVTLTVVDSLGRTATASQTVTVP
jgi:PKD repeat protein